MADAGSTTAVALPANFSIVSGSEARAAVVGQTGRVVVLNLWATWCPPCRAEFPALAELERKYRSRGVTVIALSVDETEDIDEKVRPFVEQVGADFSVLVKAPGDPRRFLTQLDRRLSGALPETVVYDREGKPAHVLAGEQSLEAFERAIRDLL